MGDVLAAPARRATGERSPTLVALRAMARNRAAVGGLIVVIALALVAVAADVISPAERGGMGVLAMSPPGADHLMGTDDLGRDLFHRFVHGARISLSLGALAAITSLAIGVVVGVVAGYYGGPVDDLLMRSTEAVQVTPRFFLALVVAVLFGASLLNIVLIIGLLSWPGIARLVRAETLSAREHEYVTAARAIGVRDRRIMFHEIMPNVVAPSIVAGSLLVSQAILIESALAFLGLGDPSRPSWGLMLNSAQPFLRIGWWLSVFPGVGILLASLGFNLMGDGLNEAFDPRLRER